MNGRAFWRLKKLKPALGPHIPDESSLFEVGIVLDLPPPIPYLLKKLVAYLSRYSWSSFCYFSSSFYIWDLIVAFSLLWRVRSLYVLMGYYLLTACF